MITLLFLINSVRINPLKIDPYLSKQACSRILEVEKNWSHDGYEKYFNEKYSYIGENLAKGFKTTKETHTALMNSVTHKANIVNKHYDHVGYCEKDGYTVELFGGNIK